VIVAFKPHIDSQQSSAVSDFLAHHDVPHTVTHRKTQSVVVIPRENESAGLKESLNHFEGIESIHQARHNFQLAARSFRDQPTRFQVKNEVIGRGHLNLVAGPCSVESRQQIMETAHYLHEMGIQFLRGGAYKPRTSPYAFQGLGREGLKLIKEAADKYEMAVITELLDYHLIAEVEAYADILQVGSRNMFNYYMLKKLGEQSKPVLLKRGMFARIEEWLLAAEYILLQGNEKVILCERGLRTFDEAVRNHMDISAIPLAQELSHLPVWADPSQGTGRRNLVQPLSMAATAAGADGLMVEVHPDPDKALSDGNQSLSLTDYQHLLSQVLPVAESLNKNPLPQQTASNSFKATIDL